MTLFRKPSVLVCLRSPITEKCTSQGPRSDAWPIPPQEALSPLTASNANLRPGPSGSAEDKAPALRERPLQPAVSTRRTRLRPDGPNEERRLQAARRLVRSRVTCVPHRAGRERVQVRERASAQAKLYYDRPSPLPKRSCPPRSRLVGCPAPMHSYARQPFIY